MLRKLGAALAACALAITVHATASAGTAAAEPKTPVVTLSPATCENKTNRVLVEGLSTEEAYRAQYRFVIEVEGRAQPVKQLNKSERPLVLTGKEADIARILGASASLGYGKKVTVKTYWFNSKAAPYKYPANQRTTVDLEFGDDLTNATLLSTSNTFTMVKPDTLNCKTLIATAPQAPSFELAAAKCEAGKATDNVMTVVKGEKHDNLRFVATHDGKSISLKDELRTKLWTAGKLSASDIQLAYPDFKFDYSKPISVQPYWFDAEQDYEPSLYDTTLALSAGESDRFIKLGQAKTLDLVDPASLKCAAPAAPSFELAAAKCEAGKATDNVMTVVKGEKHDNLRFVATHDGKSISLKDELRTKLWTAGKLSASDIQLAYPDFKFDYSKPISVQPYWFDAEQAYDASLYDTELKLFAGKSDRFIKLGQAKTLDLVDPASLKCAAPTAPSFELAAAKCEAGKATDNVMTVVKGEKHDNLRFVATHDGKSISLKDELRTKLWTAGKLSASDIQLAYPDFKFDYSKPISVQPYWFDAEKAYDASLYDTELKLFAGKSDRFIKLGQAKTLDLVDPASLKCAAPTAPSFELAAAKCEAGKATDNVMTVVKGEKHDNLRFVATHDGKSISLKDELRTKLWTAGKLSASDIQLAYPDFKFDYSKPISVQPYWFDAEKAYDASLYDTELKLFAGKSDRFIKLGQAKTLDLVDPASLKCAAPTAPSFELAAAKCEAGKATDNVMTVVKGEKHDNLRFVATHDGKSISLKDELRTKLWTAGKLSASDIQLAYPDFKFDYSKPISVQPYWFDAEKAYDVSLYDTELKLFAGKSDRFIKLGQAKTLDLVDPASLKCAAPAAPSFELAAAKCEAGKATDNVMTVDKAQKHDNLRFVATHDGKSISLKDELRTKLWTAGKLSASDIQLAYPDFKFDYSKPISVQPYWFDAEKAYDASLYDTELKLFAGKSDRFIKLGQAKTLDLVDPASLKCAAPDPSDSANPDVSQSANPDVSQSANPDVSQSANPDVSQSANPDVSQSANPDVSQSANPDVSQSANPDVSQSANPDVSQSANPDVSQSANPDVSQSANPDVSQSANPDVSQSASATASATSTAKFSVQPSSQPSASGKAANKLAKTGLDQSLMALTVALLLGAGVTMAISERRRNGR